MKVLVPLREALNDPQLLAGAMVGPSWDGWRALLLAASGARLSRGERRYFTALTGRPKEPGDGQLSEVFLCIGGRRGGKSKAMATLAVWLASCCDWTENLSLGETGRVLFVAPTERQASVVEDYVRALFASNELLRSLIEHQTAHTLTLKRSVALEVQAASAAHSRGMTAVGIILDESCFLPSGDAHNSGEDLVTALRPSLSTTGGPLLLTSSPAGAEGLVYQLYKRHYGKDGDARCIVAKGSSRELNPSLKASIIDRAYADDAVAAAAEYGAEFREPVSSYLTRELVERAIEKGVTGRVRLPQIQYEAFCDCSSGAGRDSFALCIGHKSSDRDRPVAVIDFIAEEKPPFDPVNVIRALCEHLKAWGINTVHGDQYGMPYVTTFSRNGIHYQVASPSTSEIYLHCLPSWTSGGISMLDGHSRAVDQLVSLKRKYQSGRETVSHPDRANAHDDLATVISGVIWRCTPVDHQVTWDFGGIGVVTQPYNFPGEVNAGSETMAAFNAARGYGRSDRDGRLIRYGSGNGGLVW